MITYQKNGKMAEPAQDETTEEKEKVIRVNGFQQVLDMLRVADPEFRESLLRRLASRDPSLVQSLREKLAKR